MSNLPDIEVGHMDTDTGRYVRDGQASAVYLTVAGVRVRADVHQFAGDPELGLSIDPVWSEDHHVNELDVLEVRATAHQAALRVRGR